MEAQGWTTEGCSENNFLEMKSTELWNFFLFNLVPCVVALPRLAIHSLQWI